MKHRARLYSTALLLSAVPLASVSCSKQEESASPGSASGGKSVEAVSTVPSAPVSAASWGITARLPKSTEGFVAVYRLGDLVTSFKNSGFVKKLLAVPEVAQMISMEQIDTILDNNAEAKDVLSLFATEAVFSMQEGFTENALGIANSVLPLLPLAIKSMQPQLVEPGQPPAYATVFDKDPAAVRAAVEGLLDADIPPVMIALKAGSARERVDGLLKGLTGQIPEEVKDKVDISTFKLDDKYEFQSIAFSVAKAIPPDGVEAVKAKLAKVAGDPTKAASMTGKLMAKRVELSWGWVDDNLVIGFGKDHDHVKLASAGSGVLSVREIADRAGAWEAKKPLSLSYTSLKTNQAIVAAFGGMMDTIISLVQSGAGKSPIPLDGVIADLKKLSARAREVFPTRVTATVAASWWDGGLHVESFGGPVMNTYDSSKPLSYGSLAGPATVLLSESRVNEAARDKDFAFFEEAVATLWTSFQTNIKPKLDPQAQQQMAMADAFIPMVKELWTSIQVFRSALGSESALLVNLDGAMPPIAPPDFKDVKVPRLLVVSDLKDRGKLAASWLGISKIVMNIATMTGAKIKPEPVEKKEGDVTMWGLPIPMDTGDLWPHTAVAGNRWYLGTSPSLTKEAAAKSPAPAGPPSGSHVRVNFKAVWDYANAVSSVVPIQPKEKQMMQQVMEFLRALEEIDARSGSDKGDTHIQFFIGIKDLK